ncbi:MAG: 6-bladed beta-propeller [Bacteroidales bacterium]|nr:6-bladed beta-propeller [Bacteroidales bacterium]
MRTLILVILSFLLLFTNSCISTEKSSLHDKTYIVDLSTVPDILLNLDDIITDVSIVPLETTDKSLISYVAQVDQIDDYLIIIERTNQRIKAFNIDGSFSHFIGNIGKGPGEYIYPFGFSILRPEKEILVYDTRRNVAIHYHLDGSLSKEFKVKAFGHIFGKINDTLYGMHGGRMGYIGVIDQHFELWLVNKYGEVTDSLFHYMDALGTDMVAGFIPSHHKNFVYYSKMGDYSIYQIAGDTVEILYRFDFGEDNLDSAKYLSNEYIEEFFQLEDKILSLRNITNTKMDISISADFSFIPKALIIINHQSKNKLILPADSTGIGLYHQMPIPLPQWADEEYRYSSIEAYRWVSYLNGLSASDKKKLRTKIPGFRQSEQITEEDNPILIRYKFVKF